MKKLVTILILSFGFLIAQSQTLRINAFLRDSVISPGQRALFFDTTHSGEWKNISQQAGGGGSGTPGGSNGQLQYNNAGVFGGTATGTGVLTALGVNVGSAGSFVTFGGALGTPSSANLTNAVGYLGANLVLTDITANNATTSAHGFFPKLTANTVYYVNNSGVLVALPLGANGTVLTSNGATSAPTFTSPAGTGTVTSVSFTGGIISVANPTTTPAFTVAGTSGGIPYFNSSSTWATSAALSANAIVVGGGAGAAPSSIATGTGVLTALGVNVGSAGAFVVNGGALGTPSSGTLTNATGLPPTTGISGWPANSAGVLTNDGAGVLSWGAAGSGDYQLLANNNVTGGTNNFGSITSGANNILLGNDLGNSVTSGARNILIGREVGRRLTTASDVIAIGYKNLTHVTTSANSMEGISIGHDNNGYIRYKNISIGAYNIGYNVDSVDATTSYAIAADNIAIGQENLINLRTGVDNTAVGWAIMENLDSGSFNNAYGQYAMQFLENGHRNNAFGFRAGKRINNGDRNIFIGDSSGTGGATITMNNSVFLGSNTRFTGTNIFNRVAIGDSAIVSQDNFIALGRTGTFVGIARETATESIHTDGAILLGAAAATTNGTIQWTGTDFEGRKGGAWVSLTAGGDVTKVGTPANNQLGVWTGDGTIEGDANLTFASSTLNIGVAGASTGILTVSGSSSGTITIQPAAAAGIYTLTLPTNDGDASQVLTTNGSGVLSWETVSGGSGATVALDNLSAVAINAALVLGTSDAFALGSTTKQWSDLFLAEGGVIDWDNGDLTLTQTGNTLAVAGGDFRVANPIYTTGSSAGVNLDDRTALSDYAIFVSGGLFSILDVANGFSPIVALRNQSTGLSTAGTHTTPTSFWHLKAGTATATQAPLKFTAGTNLTTPEAGAVEFDGTNYFATVSTTRYTLAKTLTATAALDFGNTVAGASTDLTITVNGAADGDAVYIGVPNASVSATDNVSYFGWVSAANTVTIRFNNNNLTNAVDPASATFRATIVKY